MAFYSARMIDASAPLPDRRTERRHTLLLRVAKLIAPNGEYLCVLRDASAEGCRLQLFHPLPAACGLRLETSENESLAIELIWQSESDFGFRLADGPVTLDSLLLDIGPFPRRAVRMKLHMPVLIHAPQGPRLAHLRDISLRGARFDSDRPLPVGHPIRFEIPLLPALTGKVRWKNGATHGAEFDIGLPLEGLARFLAATSLGEQENPTAPLRCVND
jgi:PilZ domain